MTLRGHVRNGQIALDKPLPLPEGAAVTIDALVEDAAKENGCGALLRNRRANRIALDTNLAREIATSSAY